MLRDGDDVARSRSKGGSVDAPVVHEHVSVAHQLSRRENRGRESGAEHDGVETALEELDQLPLGGLVAAHRFVDQPLQLALTQAVAAAQLLLFAKA